MKAGDKVRFTAAVIRRCDWQGTAQAMRGTVVALHAGGKVAEVDTHGTMPASRPGTTNRHIPAANLKVIA